MIARHALLQWSDNRNSTSYCSLKLKVCTSFIGCIANLFTIFGYKILISCNNLLSSLKCIKHIILCRMDTTHKFYYNAYLVIRYDICPVIRKKLFWNTISFLTDISYKNLLNNKSGTCFMLYLILHCLTQLISSHSYCSCPKYCGIYYLF